MDKTKRYKRGTPSCFNTLLLCYYGHAIYNRSVYASYVLRITVPMKRLRMSKWNHCIFYLLSSQTDDSWKWKHQAERTIIGTQLINYYTDRSFLLHTSVQLYTRTNNYRWCITYFGVLLSKFFKIHSLTSFNSICAIYAVL